ncbi:hypothetical protein AK812_SmicGene18425 [Symbiodinium microadriaticum]|uniref:Uncharacterized protein n=1 Tax=Symbiodinium microadriaticum TaxID=2951 RepID=A0A1Q9DV60_SYMMI|nr:hypothetical protein AK812_SmicGene18425 [Symbiodinium microadriaticum]
MPGRRSNALFLFLIEDLDLAVFVRKTFIELAPVVQGPEIRRSRSEPQLTELLTTPRLEISENEIEFDSVDENLQTDAARETCVPIVISALLKLSVRSG